MRHTIIKLGGSVITDKKVEDKLHLEVIEALITRVNQYQKADDEKLWLFHGGGSMAHVAAARWQHSGNDADFKAAADGMVTLNQVVQNLLTRPKQVARARDFWHHPLAQWQSSSQSQDLFLGHGDAVEVEGEKMIVSTEDQIESLVNFLDKASIRILFLTDTPGVLDENGRTILELSDSTLPHFFKNNNADVTGGMSGKMQTAFRLLSPATHITIASGLKTQNLAGWLEGDAIEGTVLK